VIDPKSDKTSGYHIFLEPAGALAGELGGIITALASEYGGPVFTPHVTLLARIPAENEEIIINKARSLASALTPFTLTLGELAIEDRYFRALYIRINELKQMCEYHAQANAEFSMTDEGYLPHLSLLYGNYPQEKKEATAAALAYPVGASFTIDRLHLYKTEGKTEDWQKVAEFSLGPSSTIHE
jgi:2'-5' RNA ligase